MKKIIGIIGKSGSGKTTVSRILEECGAHVINCDLIAREIVEPGSAALRQIEETFGTKYLQPDGSLNRKKLGKLVFQEPEALKKLNAVTHPQIEKQVLKRIESIRDGIILLDAPVLLETELKKLVSDIILVTSTHNKLIERLKKRDSLKAADAENRLNAQRTDAYFKKYAGMVLENSGSLAELRKKTKSIYETLLKEDLQMAVKKNEKLLFQREKGYDKPSPTEKKKIFEFSDGYLGFLDRAKTERTFVKKAVHALEAEGFKAFNRKGDLKPGDKVYMLNRDRALIAIKVGSGSLKNGVNLVGAHVDSPKLDFKPIPLFEQDGFLFLKTHYYGGIKKYQWPAMPLCLYGTVVLKNGKKIDICIGEDPEDPIFTITDLLPHLANTQMGKKLSEGIHAEQLNAIGATIPMDVEDVKEKIKYHFMYLLNKKYKITEADLISADMTLVPAFGFRSVGLDESLVGGYGQDDRVCAYTGLKAILDSKDSASTQVLLLADREEVGSMGNTGMESRFLEHSLEEIADKLNCKMRDVLSNSRCVSADVCAGYDPNFPEVFEKNNSVFLNGGIAIMRYTGARGKSGSSEANAEFTAQIRNIFETGNVMWQVGELGKTDEGGGGTIAQYVANLGLDVIDCGVPVLSMHSPFEVTSKFDVYMAYKGYKAFLES